MSLRDQTFIVKGTTHIIVMRRSIGYGGWGIFLLDCGSCHHLDAEAGSWRGDSRDPQLSDSADSLTNLGEAHDSINHEKSYCIAARFNLSGCIQ
jgi:hypothetical protein